jgi:hypothetical protein
MIRRNERGTSGGGGIAGAWRYVFDKQESGIYEVSKKRGMASMAV